MSIITSNTFDTNENGPKTSFLVGHWKVIVAILIATLTALHFTVHFGSTEQDKKYAIHSVRVFHAYADQGRYEEIYMEADLSFRNSQTLSDWNGRMEEVRDKFGSYRECYDARILESVQASLIQITVVCHSVFDKGRATEDFQFIRRGGSIGLAGYDIAAVDQNQPSAR